MTFLRFLFNWCIGALPDTGGALLFLVWKEKFDRKLLTNSVLNVIIPKELASANIVFKVLLAVAN